MSKKGKPMTYPKESEAKLKEANRQLRAQVKRLKNEIKELNKQVLSLHKALDKNFDQINEMMDGWTVEQAIDNAHKKDNKPTEEDVKKAIKSKFRKIYSGSKIE